MKSRLLYILLGIAAFFMGPQIFPDYNLYQFSLIAVTSLIVLGLVIVTGIAGQISLGQSAFVALGGYGAAILGAGYGIPLWLAIPLVAVLVSAVGFVLGLMTLRIEGHYLALTTMAFTAIIQLALIHADSVTGGAAGMPVPSFEIFGQTLSSGAELYYLIIPVTALLFVAVINLNNSRIGRAFVAIRQSEIAAEAMGINVLVYKASAFAASAFFGSVGGGLLAILVTYLDPAQFGITQTVYYLAIAVVGGLLSPIGAIIGTAVFVFIPEFLQTFQTYLGLVFGVLLLGFIVLRPKGLASLIDLQNLKKALFRSGGQSVGR